VGELGKLEIMRNGDSQVYILKDELARKLCASNIMELEGEWEVEIRPFVSKRSVLQNRLMWAYYEQIGKSIGCTKNQMHLYYRANFLGPKLVEVMGKVFNELPSTTELTTKEMAEYITNIEIHAAENGIQLLAPPYREEAMR
jgi:hypothetical protein